MVEKFKLRIEAERFIHNDLSNCAWCFNKEVQKKFDSGETEGVYHEMLACLVFSAFSVEAKVNFVGWKVLEKGWPERANLREKINLLNVHLDCDLVWSERPLHTIRELKRFRDTVAHGKPEIVDETKIVNVEPEIWDALKGQWEQSVNRDFVQRCIDDEKKLWNVLLEKADIELYQTITHGGHNLKAIVED